MNIPAIILGVILAASVGINWFLYSDNLGLSEKKAEVEIRAATLENVLEYRKTEAERNEAKLADYQKTIHTLTVQKDSYKRRMQEAMRHDKELSEWASTNLPAHIIEQLGRMRKERSQRSSSSGIKDTVSVPDGNTVPR